MAHARNRNQERRPSFFHGRELSSPRYTPSRSEVSNSTNSPRTDSSDSVVRFADEETASHTRSQAVLETKAQKQELRTAPELPKLKPEIIERNCLADKRPVSKSTVNDSPSCSILPLGFKPTSSA